MGIEIPSPRQPCQIPRCVDGIRDETVKLDRSAELLTSTSPKMNWRRYQHGYSKRLQRSANFFLTKTRLLLLSTFICTMTVRNFVSYLCQLVFAAIL